MTERCLYEDNKWHPTTGYGFEPKLTLAGSKMSKIDSEIEIYKLHGSVGWKITDHEKFYIDKDFLKYLLKNNGEVSDENEPESYDLSTTNLLIYPSYLKKIEGDIMKKIWAKAQSVIMEIDKIIIVGYSLPDDDIAIRTLINPLTQKKIDTIVIDKNKDILNKWENFFGRKITAFRGTAQQYADTI